MVRFCCKTPAGEETILSQGVFLKFEPLIVGMNGRDESTNTIAEKPDPFRISSVERTSSDGLRPLFPTTYLLSEVIKRALHD